VGDATLLVPRKVRTVGVKRKLDDVEPIGTQQSVNKV